MINQLRLQSAFCKMDDGVNGDVKTLWTGCLMRVKRLKEQFNTTLFQFWKLKLCRDIKEPCLFCKNKQKIAYQI